MEIMVNDLGWDKFTNFSDAMKASYDESVEEYKKQMEAQMQEASNDETPEVGEPEAEGTEEN